MSTARNDSAHSPIKKSAQSETVGSLSRRMGRRAVLGLAACGLLWLFGCATAFDGGTIPGGIGGGNTRAARVFGQVVDAVNPTQPVSNVLVSITTTPNSRAATQLVQTRTDSNGAFDLSNVIVGTTTTQVQVTLTPADPSFRSQVIAFDLSGGQPADMLIALDPTAMPNSGTLVTLSPTMASVQVNTPQPLKAQVLDAQGHALKNLLPNLIYIGSSGTLSTAGFKADGSDAIFNPSAPGAGTITALWNGAVSPPADIVVSKPASTSGGPPSPPTPTTQSATPRLSHSRG